MELIFDGDSYFLLAADNPCSAPPPWQANPYDFPGILHHGTLPRWFLSQPSSFW